MTEHAASAMPTVVVVDVANVMGSRPDGWWKDRAAAATRLLADLPGLVGRPVGAPDGVDLVIARVVAVLEGEAKAAAEPDGVLVVRAPADGDTTIASAAADAHRAGEHVLVVTADRGLRGRLGDGIAVAGPGWLNALLGR